MGTLEDGNSMDETLGDATSAAQLDPSVFCGLAMQVHVADALRWRRSSVLVLSYGTQGEHKLAKCIL